MNKAVLTDGSSLLNLIDEIIQVIFDDVSKELNLSVPSRVQLFTER